MNWGNLIVENITLFIIIIIIIYLALLFPLIFLLFQAFTRYKRGLLDKKSYRRLVLQTCVMAFLVFVCCVCCILSFLPSSDSTDDTDISTRIEIISQDLSESSKELASIQKELEERIEYVENLKTEAEVAENMISLTDEQVAAIQSKLNQELSSSGRQSLIQGILISAFFFILGYVVNWFKTKLKDKFTYNSTDRLSQYSDEEIDAALNLLASLKNTDNSKSTKSK